jgi:hypothetical protein
MSPSLAVRAIFAHFPINFNLRLPQENKPCTTTGALRAPDGKLEHFKTNLCRHHTFESSRAER